MGTMLAVRSYAVARCLAESCGWNSGPGDVDASLLAAEEHSADHGHVLAVTLMVYPPKD